MNKNNLGNADISSQDRLPFSQACENNKAPILNVLQKELQEHTHVLEVGSGTGQHSVYFAPRLPHLQWQTSDVTDNHQVIQAWHDAYPASNLYAPLAFNLLTDSIPKTNTGEPYDAIFTANTLHIIAWPLVERLFELVGEALPLDGKLIVYGPFNENGRYTSASNQQFDSTLRQRDPNSGIRHKEDIIALAKQHNLELSCEYQMPANNQFLVFQKITAN
jgi:cyclopropane fatty-acyl-phospholipid synthase-like methyltransferase